MGNFVIDEAKCHEYLKMMMLNPVKAELPTIKIGVPINRSDIL